jgi:hypothetical protein
LKERQIKVVPSILLFSLASPPPSSHQQQPAAASSNNKNKNKTNKQTTTFPGLVFPSAGWFVPVTITLCHTNQQHMSW